MDGEPTQSVWVFHDERTDDAGTDKARWTTTRINLKIMGYIGNDANSDKRMRGDEALAGVAVQAQFSRARATLVNFALVYTDGELSGGVSNVSGSDRDIDLRVYRERDDHLKEVITDSRGRFVTGGLTEGSCRVEIGDARFAAPCLTSADGTPDDDGPDDDADGERDPVAVLEVNGDLRGRKARASLGILHVSVWPGPDTDAIVGPQFRHDGCHFNYQGIDAHARL